jgi:hypothetical protein
MVTYAFFPSLKHLYRLIIIIVSAKGCTTDVLGLNQCPKWAGIPYRNFFVATFHTGTYQYTLRATLDFPG